MQIHSHTNNSNTTFQAKISPEFISAAKNYYTKTSNAAQSEAKINKFMHKVGEYEKFGSDDITIIHKKISHNPQQHALYATKEGMKPEEYIVLTVKDQFRKVLEKFQRINQYEFDIKTKDIK